MELLRQFARNWCLRSCLQSTQLLYGIDLHLVSRSAGNSHIALDGKHCVIQCPPKFGSLFWNYKKSFSIALLGLIVSRYKFLMIDTGACSTEGDSNTFLNCAFSQKFLADEITFPHPRNLPDTSLRAPFVIIADKAFPSMINLLKPYPKRSKQATTKQGPFSTTGCLEYEWQWSVHLVFFDWGSGFC